MSLKIKDYIFIGIMSIIGLVIYMISGGFSSLFGVYGHVVSPGVFGLFGGTLMVFMSYKLAKPGMMIVFTVIQMMVFTLMGGGYLPWVITAMTGAIIGDIILSKGGFDKFWSQASCWALMQLGSACGSFVPVWFFAESFKQTWVERGQSVEGMDAQIMYATGMWGVISVSIVIILSVLGIYIGRTILSKYFKKH